MVVVSKRSPVKTALLVLGFTFLLFIGFSAFAIFYTGSTKSIKETADTFRPDDTWTLISEDIEPPRLLCLNGQACPSIHKTWKRSPVASSETEVTRYLRRTNWLIDDMSSCESVFLKSEQASCTVRGVSGDGRYDIILSLRAEDNEEWLVIAIEESD